MNQDTMPRVKKESKNKIRVEFDRTPLKERLMAKFLSLFFLKKVVWYIFRLVLLIGISYVILAPFLTMLMRSFMTIDDIVDPNVMLIPKNFTFAIYKEIWLQNGYLEAFVNTFILSASTALIQTFICCLIGYGLAKFRFKGNKLIFLAVIFTMIVPHQTLSSAMYMNFSSFDIFGIFQFINGGGINFFGTTITSSRSISFRIRSSSRSLPKTVSTCSAPTSRSMCFPSADLHLRTVCTSSCSVSSTRAFRMNLKNLLTWTDRVPSVPSSKSFSRSPSR